MSNNTQLLWRQGQFLTPQHLQQQDLFHQGQQHKFWHLAQPLGWGVLRLRIHEAGLDACTFEVLECEFISRNGVFISSGRESTNGNASIAPRNFKEFVDPTAEPLSVYIGLPLPSSEHSTVGIDKPNPSSLPSGFYSITKKCADIFNDEGPEKEIDFIGYHLSLFFDREDKFADVDRAFELLKIAELTPIPNGAGVRLSTHYIPPCVMIDSSLVLIERLKSVRDLLTARVQDFAAMKRQRGIRATASSLQEVLRLIMLQSLSRFTPLLHHYLELGYIHPERMYGLLRQIVGELSAFSEEITMLGAIQDKEDLPAYDHQNIWYCFDEVISRIQDLVKSMTQGPDAGIRLNFDGKYFKASLSTELFAGERNKYYLMIDNAINGQTLAALLQRTGKISARRDMERLRNVALFGLKITYLQVPPESLPQRSARYSYFEIDTKSSHWEHIRDAGDIAVYCDLDPNETLMKLFVVHED